MNFMEFDDFSQTHPRPASNETTFFHYTFLGIQSVVTQVNSSKKIGL